MGENREERPRIRKEKGSWADKKGFYTGFPVNKKPVYNATYFLICTCVICFSTFQIFEKIRSDMILLVASKFYFTFVKL